MYHHFGINITYDFFVKSKDEGYFDMSSITDNPTIYVFDDTVGKPNRTVAAAGTGAAQTISSWSDITHTETDAKGKQFTITALDDPDNTSSKDRYTYWLAINYVLVDSGTSMTEIRALPIARPETQSNVVSATKTDLEAIYPGIDNIVSDTNQNSAIKYAAKRTEIDLESAGYEYAQVWESDDLNLAVTYRALAQLMLAQMVQEGDQWHQRHEEYKMIYEGMISSIRLRYDSDNDNEPDVREAKGNSIRIIR